MKKTQLLLSLLSVKQNKTQAVAMLIFIAGAICLYTGIGWRSQSMANVVDRAYQQSNLHQIKIVIPDGVDNETIDKLDKAIDADAVVGGCDDYEEFIYEGETKQVLVKLLQTEVSRPYEIEGRLPEVEGEIAVKKNWALEHGVNIGDTITFEDIEEGIPSKLETSVFTVTALVEMAEYLSTKEGTFGVSPRNGKSISCVMYASDSSFNDASRETWTQILIYKKELDTVSTFSDEFAEMSDKLEAQTDEALEEILPDDTEYTIQTRSRTYSYSIVDMVDGILDGMNSSLVAMFIFIGLLICYSCITRMVSDELVSMGTKKALGMTTKEIQAQYLFFAGFVLLASSVSGVLLGRFVVEPLMVVNADDIVVDISENIFRWKDVIIIVGIEIIGIIGTTVVTIQQHTRKPAKELLQGPIPAEGKARWFEKTKAWNKLPLLYKAIVNNFFNEKSRVISTIIGVAGVTMLVVSPITCYFNVMDCFNRHFDEYYYFDYIINFDESEAFAEKKIKDVLDGYGIEYTSLHIMNATIENRDDGATNFKIFVPLDRSAFHKLVHIEGTGGETYEPYSGTWMTQAYMEYYNIPIGSKMEFSDVIDDPVDVTIDGIAKHYLMDNAGYMDKATYEQYFEQTAEANAFIIDSGLIPFSVLERELKTIDGFTNIQDYESDSKDSFDSIRLLLIGMAAIYVVLAIWVAFLVILNLFYIYVEEKRKEIIVLRINGYSMKEAKDYVSKDNLFTSTISILIGVMLGEAFGCYSVSTYISKSSYYDTSFDIKSALIGFVISLIIIIELNEKAKKKVDELELCDIKY